MSAAVVTLSPVQLGRRIVWSLSFADSVTEGAVDLTGATIAVTVNANNQSFNPTITATLDSATTMPQATATLETTDYGALTAPTVLYVYATATIAGEIVSSVEFNQPIDPNTADSTALVDTDEVAKAVFFLPYASLSTDDQKSVNEAVFKAKRRVGQWAQHVALSGPDGFPDVWRDWANIEAEYALSRFKRPERMGELAKARDDARDEAMSTFVSAYATSGTLFGTSSLNALDVRKYVMACLAKQSPRPIFVDAFTIDAALQDVLTVFWNKGDWSFRRRPFRLYLNPIAFTGGGWTESSKTITGIDSTDYTHASGTVAVLTGGTNVLLGDALIASKPGNTSITTTSTISMTGGNLANADIAGTILATTLTGLGAGEEFSQLGTTALTTSTGQQVKWATPDWYAYRRAQAGYTQNYSPQTFRFENHGTYFSWRFDPIPSEAVTLHGQAIIKGPILPTGSSAAADTTAFARVPSECYPYIKEATLCALLDRHNAPNGGERRVRLEQMMSALLVKFVQHGAAEEDGPPRDVYGDVFEFRGGLGGGGGSLSNWGY